MSTFRAWMPLVLMSALIVGLGAYAAVHQDAFLTKYNLGNLLLARCSRLWRDYSTS